MNAQKKRPHGIRPHVAFYAGWPKAWAVFDMAKTVWTEPAEDGEEAKAAHAASMIFPIGAPNEDSWFSHLAVEVPGKNAFNEWLEPVGEEEYGKLG